MPRIITEYFKDLCAAVEEYGGFYNAHLHLDRSDTLSDTLKIIRQQESEASHLSISHKHSLIPLVHASDCYDTDRLYTRVSNYLQMMVDVGTTCADTVVDVTDDRVGLGALDCLLQIKEDFKDKLLFKVGAYSPLGFRDDQPQRWTLLETAAEKADFIGSLPERDDINRYPEHIGFVESCRRVLALSEKLQKPVHIHVDQQNIPQERDSERVIEIIKNNPVAINKDGDPLVWLVHVISPSTYPEEQFNNLVDDLVKFNIGVICCPSAALSMRQIRPIATPTFNSIARVLEMLAAGVRVRIGSDNICDITSPAGTVDLLDELYVLCNALRYYDIPVLAKLGAGIPLSTLDQSRIQAHLAADKLEADNVIARIDSTQRI